MQENGLMRKLRLILIFIKSQAGKRIITIYILPNISKNKGSQILKFGQLIKYNGRNVFPEKSWTKYGGETSPRPFFVKSKLNISLDHSLKFYTVSFCRMTSSRTTKIHWNQGADHLLLLHIKLFKKFKKWSGPSLPASFLPLFLKKNISHVLLIDQISLFDCLYFLRYWAICKLTFFISQFVTL